jgi:O-antigen/teichoic acid export membrane protein
VGITALLLLQDGLRYVAVALHHARIVLASDSVWLAAAIVAMAASLGHRSLNVVLGVWLLGGLVAISLLVPTGRKAAAPLGWGSVTGFFGTTRELSGWLALQYMVSNGAVQLAMIGLAVTVGNSDYGGLRSVQLLIAPVLALIFASTSPLMVWMANRSGERWTRSRLIAASAAFAGVSAVPCVVLVVAGRWLLETFPGPAYLPYEDLVLPLALSVVAVAAAVPLGAFLRQSAEGRRVFVAGLVGTVPGAVLSVVAASRYGVQAAAWVFVLLYAVVWGACLVVAMRTLSEQEAAFTQAPSDGQPGLSG